jgi:hypothetical protein
MGKNGGKRPGAGRPKRALSRRNKEIVEAVLKDGETPLEYMLRVMRDPNEDEDRRGEMAKAAAPYVHARLSSTQSGSNKEQPMVLQVLDVPREGE